MDMIYYQLRSYLVHREEQQRVQFKLGELPEVWLCTLKQCKRRLQGYQQDGKLIYLPGRGRGKLSELIFSQPFQQEIEGELALAIQQNALDEVVQLLQLDIPKEWFKGVFQEIQGLFGLQNSQADKQTLRYILRRPLTSLDPLVTAVSKESFMIRQLGDTLLNYDTDKGRLQPGLAHHWRVSPDYRRWTFFLRKGVRFHHGRTLTSEDVRHTLLRAKMKGSVSAWQLENVKQIICENDFVISVELNKGEPFLGHYLTLGNLTILPHDVPFDETKWVSTGPFQIRERTPHSIILEVFEEYYGERPLMDRIEFWVVEDSKLPMTISPDAAYSSREDYVEQSRKNDGVEFLIFNFKQPSIVHKAPFREALYLLTDGEELKKELDIGKPASRFYPDKSQTVQKDVQRVPELLEQAGYQGETLVLGVLNYVQAGEKGVWLQKRAAEYGINLELQTRSFEVDFYSEEFEKETHMMMLGDIPVTDRELSFIDFCSNPNLSCQRFFSAEIVNSLNKKIERMKFCEHYEQRLQEYEAIDQWLTENYFLVYYYHPEKKELVHPTVKQQGSDPVGKLNLRTVWVEWGNYK